MSKKTFDKETVALILIGCVLMFGWQWLFGPRGFNWTATPPKATPTATAPDTVAKPTPPVAPKTAPDTPIAKPAVLSAPTLKTERLENWEKTYPDVTLKRADFPAEVTVSLTRGEVASVKLPTFTRMDNTGPVVLNQGVSPGALAMTFAPDTGWALMKIAPKRLGDDALELDREFVRERDNARLIARQKWSLEKKPYVVRYEAGLKNVGAVPIDFNEILVWAGAIPPVHQLSGDEARGEAHCIDRVLVATLANKDVRADNKSLDGPGLSHADPVRLIGVSNKFFACVLAPETPFAGGDLCRREERAMTSGPVGQRYPIATIAGRVPNVSLAPTQSATWKFNYYAGPKEIGLLGAFDPYGPTVMHLAWPFIETLAQWFLYSLIFLKGLVGSYGWAIIALTVIVKLIFWPITHKANQSMKKMQRVQPMMKELREKYQDNRELLNQKMMELYRREKINPVGGCLPILIQIPIFIALYWTLDGAIELRHASFLWAHDLTGPDTIFTIPLIGLPINPLAISMAATMFVQQLMTPTAADPIQAKMMLFMPLIMLFFLYMLPSGLTLYWTVSQIISIAQLAHNKYLDRNEKLVNHKTA